MSKVAVNAVRLQQIFDDIKTHLIKQNDYSAITIERDGKKIFQGQYRGPGGKRCAAGAVIPDADYDASWEGKAAHTLDFFQQNFTKEELSLIDRMQFIHDFQPLEEWYMEMQVVAFDYDLNP